MSSYTDIFSGDVIYPAYISYQAISLTADTELSWPTQFQNTNNVVSAIMDVSPDQNGWSLVLPDATQTSVGQSFLINNPTGFTFDLEDANGSIIVNDFPITSTYYFYLIDNSTVGGQWRQTPFGDSATVVTSVAAVSSTPNITITGSPITTSGTFTFNIAADLGALAGFGASTGIAVHTATDTWALRTLTGTSNQITITNGTGVAGNPNVALSPVITGISSLTAGNLTIASNTISAANADGSITLTPNGTGVINLSSTTRLLTGEDLRFIAPTGSNYIGFSAGNMSVTVDLVWPTVAPVAGQVLSYTSGTALGWSTVSTFGGPSTVNAIAKYSNTSGALQDSGVIIDASNNVTGANSLVAGNIEIGLVTASTISTSGLNQDLSLTPNGTGLVLSNASVGIRTGNELRFFNAANTQYVGFQAGSPGSNVIWTLPTTDSTGTQALVSDGAGIMSWTSVGGTVTSVGTGTGLTGGPITTTGTVSLANTTVVAGTYSNASITVDAQGRLTAASSGASGGVSSVTGTANQITASPTSGAVGLSFPNDISVTSTISVGAGIVAAPSYTFTGDIDTGMWHSAANTLDFSTNGLRALQLAASPGGSVNYLELTASAPGNPIELTAAGTDTNIGIQLVPKGTGGVENEAGAIATPSYTFIGDVDTGIWHSGANTLDFSTNALRALQLVAAPASSVNYLTITPSVTTSPVLISAEGTDTNISIGVVPKGTGQLLNAIGTNAAPGYSFSSDTDSGMLYDTTNVLIAFANSGGRQLEVEGPASTNNYFRISGNTGLSSPILEAISPFANMNMEIRAKGTGVIFINTGSATIPTLGFTGRFFVGMSSSAGNTIDFMTNNAGSTAGTTQLRITNSASNCVNFVQVSGSVTTSPVLIDAAGTDTNIDMRLSPKGTGALFTNANVGIGTNTFGTSATQTLSIETGTAPTTGPADTVQIYSSDLSAGNTMLSIFTEGTVVSASVAVVTTSIAIRVNGTIYYLKASLTP